MAKLYDLAVVVGTYTDRDGNEKKRWKTIGSILETKDGGQLILLDRTFNPAGVPVEDGRDSVMVSMFKPKEVGGAPAQYSSAPPASAPMRGNQDFGVDDIPF